MIQNTRANTRFLAKRSMDAISKPDPRMFRRCMYLARGNMGYRGAVKTDRSRGVNAMPCTAIFPVLLYEDGSRLIRRVAGSCVR